MRLELTRSCDHYPLKVACIPISPPALRRNSLVTKFVATRQKVTAVAPLPTANASLVCVGDPNNKKERDVHENVLCPEQDSNLHTSRHAHLKRTRLPIPPSGLANPIRVPLEKKSRNLVLLFSIRERKTRLELATPTLARSCSTN